MRMEIDIDEYDYEKVKELVSDGVFDYEGTTAHLYKSVANGKVEDLPNTDAIGKEEYVKKSDIVDMYENDFPNLDDGVHWSRSDIINNLDDVPSYFMTPVECTEVRPITHSHWVHHKGEYHEYVSCAKCGELAKCAEMADCVLWKYSTYCSDCGSIMDGEIEEVEE